MEKIDRPVTVADVVDALDRITGGRVCVNASDLFSGRNRFVVTKSSGLPGKAVTETPGLVFGAPTGRSRNSPFR